MRTASYIIDDGYSRMKMTINIKDVHFTNDTADSFIKYNIIEHIATNNSCAILNHKYLRQKNFNEAIIKFNMIDPKKISPNRKRVYDLIIATFRTIKIDQTADKSSAV